MAASILAVDLASHEMCVHGSVHEFDDGVMLELEELSEIGDRRGVHFGEAPDREEELVLVWCEAFASSGFFGEPQEDPQGVPELGESPVLGLGQHLSRLPRSAILLLAWPGPIVSQQVVCWW